ncbi:restriction endonuclease subunit S [uncultured Acidovorax sp.]|uniref:restriction endonuclease subunit S n=1 Tax=uncultured Acidovorax sp. TaxID=158751 RepID=UPI00258DD20E|nr:restriction endonuclease subunit S [uncultured Acidovorax sp.]
MLLSNMELIATAPGGVAKLRELILTLAVQGKLVPQDPADEPAGVLLQKIRAEKDRLIVEGKSKRDKPLAAIAEEEKPFELPLGWEWVRLGSVLSLEYGSALPEKERLPGSIPVYGSNGIVGFHSSALVSEPSLIVGRKGSVGAINISLVPFWSIDTSYFVTPPSGIELHFAFHLLRSLGLAKHDKATAIPGINRNDVYAEIVGLPPLAEQSRIVTRVEALMRLCDALEAKGQLEAAQHAQLVSTLLGTLTASTSPGELADNWQRVAQHFDLLLDRPAAIDALEQTLLQLAVRGLLVPQDPTDEPATELIVRVMQRKAASAGKSRKPTDDKLPLFPYELPDRWTWAQLGDLVENMGSGWSPACDEGERSDPTRWAVLRTTAVQVNEFRPREHKVLPNKLSPRPEIEVQDGDILITRAGPMNRVGISCWVDRAPPRLMLSDKIVRFHPVADEMLPAFIVLTLNAGYTKDQIEAAKSGMAASQVNISQSDLRGFWIPVCSKTEQSRIVTRVTALRRLCADLRQRLAEREAVQARLAEALVESVG